jgi:hypothetical protein
MVIEIAAADGVEVLVLVDNVTDAVQVDCGALTSSRHPICAGPAGHHEDERPVVNPLRALH